MKRKQTTKRQHTVPKCYLQAFCSDEEKKCLVQYDKEDASARSVLLTDASVVKHCYSFVDSAAKWNDAAERAFATVESDAAPLLEELCQHAGTEFSKDERFVIAKFIVLQMRRPHAQMKHSRGELEKGLNDPAVLLGQLEKSLPKLRRRYGDDEIEGYRSALLAGEVEAVSPDGDAKKSGLRLLLERLPVNASILEEMSWQVLTACHGHFFVCSDAPAYVRRQNSDADPGVVGLGRGDLKAQLYMPLTPTRFLVAGHAILKPLAKASKTRVQELNRRTARMADRWIYSHHASTRVHRLVDEAKGTTPPFPYFDFNS